MENQHSNNHEKSANPTPQKKSPGILRLSDPDLAPSVRGAIVLTIIFKVIIMNAAKGSSSQFMLILDSAATFALVIAMLILGMLLWRKYTDPEIRKQRKSARDS